MKKKIIQFIRKLVGTDKIFQYQHKVHEKQRRKLEEIYKALLFESTIKNSEWLKNKSFSPGRMAVDFGFLFTLYRVLNDTKPKKIVEFGLGQSTRMISQYCDFFKASCITFEHNQNWIDHFRQDFNHTQHLTIFKDELLDVEYKGVKTARYKSDIGNICGENIELVVLDGPVGSPHFSRSQILDLMPSKINQSNFCIILDDLVRDGEKETANEIFSRLKENEIEFEAKIYSAENDHLVICSSNNHFLTSL